MGKREGEGRRGKAEKGNDVKRRDELVGCLGSQHSEGVVLCWLQSTSHDLQ